MLNESYNSTLFSTLFASFAVKRGCALWLLGVDVAHRNFNNKLIIKI